jgi:glycosyltransferase involved in cell wall biosynthesis
MRVLLLSPYAPHEAHDHAAADTIVRLVPLLAQKTELFVYSPGARAAAGAGADLSYTVLPSTAVARDRVRHRLGLKPGWLRQAWPRPAAAEAVELVRRLRPDVVHAEYLQSAEILRHCANSVLGLHDITEHVMWEAYRAAPGRQKPYRLAEALRTRFFERAAIRRAAVVVTLSDTDLAAASAHHRRVVLARPGVDVDDVSWSPPRDASRPVLVFAGAMWRRANALTAQLLVRDVMPIVWQAFPTAELRIVGARPTRDVLALATDDRRVTVTGAVPDPRTEMSQAHAVVAPSVVGGGVLMKVLHAMALGCPVVTSEGPARSVAGDATTLFIGSTTEEIAGAVRAVLESPREAARRGQLARAHVSQLFQWDSMVAAYLDAYVMASRR